MHLIFKSAIILGIKSLINLNKISLSSGTILGLLKSLKPLIRSRSSKISRFALLIPPACLNADKMPLVLNHNVFIWIVILLNMLKETNFLNKYLADVKPSEINIFS